MYGQPACMVSFLCTKPRTFQPGRTYTTISCEHVIIWTRKRIPPGNSTTSLSTDSTWMDGNIVSTHEKVKSDASDRQNEDGWKLENAKWELEFGSLSSRLLLLSSGAMYYAVKVNDPSTLQVIEKPWLSRSLVWLTQVTSSGVESYFLSTWLKLNRKISHWTQIFWDSSQKSDSSWANLTFTYSNTAIYLLHLFFPCSLNWDAANEQIEYLAIPYFDNHLFIIRVQ